MKQCINNCSYSTYFQKDSVCKEGVCSCGEGYFGRDCWTRAEYMLDNVDYSLTLIQNSWVNKYYYIEDFSKDYIVNI